MKSFDEKRGGIVKSRIYDNDSEFLGRLEFMAKNYMRKLNIDMDSWMDFYQDSIVAILDTDMDRVEKFDNWYFGLLLNLRNSSLRKRKLLHLPDDYDISSDALDLCSMTVDEETLVELVDELGTGKYECLVLRDIYEISGSIVGDILGITRNYADLKLHRQRRSLREKVNLS